MAEIRNNFVKSKMNKDLDDRLLSNGEYRDAQNVNVSRSEGEDVGALENILGNKLITSFGLSTIDNLEIIGYLSDDTNNRVFFIATNYTDSSDDTLSNPAPAGSSCYILMSDLKNNTNQILVQGRFLNFSKTHPIYHLDLMEDLLFWTDNRNQPRKINIAKAIVGSGYYVNEDTISVAKYFPYNAPFMYDTLVLSSVTTNNSNICTSSIANADTLRAGMQILTPASFAERFQKPVFIISVSYATTGSSVGQFIVSQSLPAGTNQFTFIYPTSQNRTDEFITPSSMASFDSIAGASNPFTVSFSEQTHPLPSVGSMSLQVNMLVTCPGKINERVLTTGQTSGVTAVEVDKDITSSPNSVVVGDILEFSFPNPWYTNTWPGDKELLTNKFVRFAYRFKFDDGEYSLISPFTQPAFIPKQDGYIISEPTNNTPQVYSNQDEGIGASTIISFFENKVDDVGLKIETPFPVNQLSGLLKIDEIDILYKESDGLAIQVLETIPVTDASITTNTTTTYTYTYQSRKPFRTLPAAETTRVFDKVPIRAMSQSSVGSRIIYGNFLDKHSPPQNINYSVNSGPKYKVNEASTIYSTVSTPNHTLKQNRTYQVGIVLADRYGRQSDVVLSSLSNFQYSQAGSSDQFDGSTVFHPYYSEADSISKSVPIGGSGANAGSGWFGDSLKILFNEKIPAVATGENAIGYPGLYKSGNYKAVVSPAIIDSNTAVVDSIDINIAIGDVVSGQNVSIIAIDQGTNTLTFSNTITIDNNKTITILGPENKLGWYSYKVVVKQQAQDYYNTYLANISSRPVQVVQNITRATGAPVTGVGTDVISFNIASIPKFQNVSIGDLVTGSGVAVGSSEPAETTLPATVISKNNFGVKLNMNITFGASQVFEFTGPNYKGPSSEYINNQAFYTTLISDNVNKIPADLQEVQPEQTQFRTSDVILYPRVTSLVIGSFNGVAQRHLGTKFATASTIGKINDLGLQAFITDNKGNNTNVVPTQSRGLFQAQTNPPTAILLSDGITLGSTTTATSLPANYFSYLEVKPPDSLLNIFYETSTSGLVSQLNADIDAGVGSSQTDPVPPLAPISR